MSGNTSSVFMRTCRNWPIWDSCSLVLWRSSRRKTRYTLTTHSLHKQNRSTAQSPSPTTAFEFHHRVMSWNLPLKFGIVHIYLDLLHLARLIDPPSSTHQLLPCQENACHRACVKPTVKWAPSVCLLYAPRWMNMATEHSSAPNNVILPFREHGAVKVADKHSLTNVYCCAFLKTIL